MDEQTERQRLEMVLQTATPDSAFAYLLLNIDQQLRSVMFDAMVEVWLQAKRDAKPLVRVVSGKGLEGHRNYTYYGAPFIAKNFDSRAAAEYDAVERGCRIS